MNSEQKIWSYLNGDMDKQEKFTFEQELTKDESLKNEFLQYQALHKEIDEYEAEKPSKKMDRKFEAMLSSEMAKLEYKQPKKANVFFRSSWFKAASIAFVLFLFGVIIGSYYQKQQRGQLSQTFTNPAVYEEFQHHIKARRTSHRIHGVGLTNESKQLDSDVLTTLEKLLHEDPSNNVRLAVVESLAKHQEQEKVRKVLLKALTGIDIIIVQIAIIDHLTKSGKKDAVPVFEQLLNHEQLDKTVQGEIHAGLRKLSRII